MIDHDDLDEFVALVGTSEQQPDEFYYTRLHEIHPSNLLNSNTYHQSKAWKEYQSYSTKWVSLSEKIHSTGPDGGWDDLRIDKLKYLEEWFQRMGEDYMT